MGNIVDVVIYPRVIRPPGSESTYQQYGSAKPRVMKMQPGYYTFFESRPMQQRIKRVPESKIQVYKSSKQIIVGESVFRFVLLHKFTLPLLTLVRVFIARGPDSTYPAGLPILWALVRSKVPFRFVEILFPGAMILVIHRRFN